MKASLLDEKSIQKHAQRRWNCCSRIDDGAIAAFRCLKGNERALSGSISNAIAACMRQASVSAYNLDALGSFRQEGWITAVDTVDGRPDFSSNRGSCETRSALKTDEANVCFPPRPKRRRSYRRHGRRIATFGDVEDAEMKPCILISLSLSSFVLQETLSTTAATLHFTCIPSAEERSKRLEAAVFLPLLKLLRPSIAAVFRTVTTLVMTGKSGPPLFSPTRFSLHFPLHETFCSDCGSFVDVRPRARSVARPKSKRCGQEKQQRQRQRQQASQSSSSSSNCSNQLSRPAARARNRQCAPRPLDGGSRRTGRGNADSSAVCACGVTYSSCAAFLQRRYGGFDDCVRFNGMCARCVGDNREMQMQRFQSLHH